MSTRPMVKESEIQGYITGLWDRSGHDPESYIHLLEDAVAEGMRVNVGLIHENKELREAQA
jgi:hypothetical protein